MRHIHAVLVFLGDFVLEEGGQKQYRTDRRISGVIYLAAVVGGILGIFMTSRVIASSQMKNGTKIVLSFGYPILVWVFLFLAFFVAGMAAAVATMGAVG